jgi:hypothetical protein
VVEYHRHQPKEFEPDSASAPLMRDRATDPARVPDRVDDEEAIVVAAWR